MSAIVFCSPTESFLPSRKTDGAVCRDICATQEVNIPPHQVGLIPTGVKIAFPPSRHAKIYARSSLPTKKGLNLANGVAVMDSDYRGEYIVQLLNITQDPVFCAKGERIAQIELCPTYRSGQDFSPLPPIETIVSDVVFDTFHDQYPTKRGEGKFGSTGGYRSP